MPWIKQTVPETARSERASQHGEAEDDKLCPYISCMALIPGRRNRVRSGPKIRQPHIDERR